MKRQQRRLQHVLNKFASIAGDGGDAVRVWGSKDVERTDGGWQFHIHMLVDLGGANADELAKMLRCAWKGARHVQIKPMEARDHEANLTRLAHYLIKARFTHSVGNRREWLPVEQIVELALWRDGLPAQWHRFSWHVRRRPT